MAEKQYFLVQVKRASGSSSYLTLTEVAFKCGVHPELIERFIRLGLIDEVDSSPEGESLFPASVLAEIRRILRLRNQLGVNYAGVGVILDLLSRIESQERTIRELERRIFGEK